jgi:hypothetical protein
MEISWVALGPKEMNVIAGRLDAPALTGAVRLHRVVHSNPLWKSVNTGCLGQAPVPLHARAASAILVPLEVCAVQTARQGWSIKE